ncbi:TPA: metallophosphoesterase, partial [Shigella flexneri]|nr:metallophosphoesterase [Shigella flexneri]
EEHDAAVLDSYRASLRKGDDLWILGDLTVGSKSAEERALALLWRLRFSVGCRLHLIAGNHDSVSPVHRESHKRFDAFTETFNSVQAYARKRGPDKCSVWLSHYPYASTGDGEGRGPARYLHHRLPDLGDWLLHGHTHQEHVRTSPREIHIGWDTWRRPVAWDEIEKIIKETA